MKKFLLLGLLPLLLVGCVRIRKQETPADRAIYLQLFLEGKVQTDIFDPWQTLARAERVNRYLAASDEVRKSEAFRDLQGKVFSGLTGEVIVQGYFRAMTDGKSLTEEGAVWKINYPAGRIGTLTVTCTGPLTWDVTAREEKPRPDAYSLTVKQSDAGSGSWTLEYSRKETAGDKSVLLQSEGLSGTWRQQPQDTKPVGLSGRVLLDIHAGGTRIDWAAATLRPDGTADYRTSRGAND